MQHRLAATGLAAALALSPALAFAQGATGGTGAASQTATQMQSASPTMGEMEATHAKRTMTLGALSLETSRIALEKLKDDDLKEFARFEVTEQEGIANVLKAMAEPDTTATTKAPSQSEAMGELDAAGKETLEKLRSTKAGPDFDALYLQGQLKTHEQLLDAQQAYLKGGKDREHRALAILSSGQIKEHIALLKDIKSDMKDD